MLSDLYIRSKSNREPLRIGLLLDELELPRMFYQVVEDIARSNFAVIKLAVINQQPPPQQRPVPPVPVRAWRILSDPARRKAVFYKWYSKTDAQNHPLQPDPSESIDASPLLEGVPRLPVVPITKRFVHRFPPEAIEAIQAYDLDVIFRFGFNILKGDVLRTARYGIWSFHHGDNEFYRGGPPHFWELVEQSPVSGVILQVLTEQLDAGIVLAKINFATLSSLSPHSNSWAPCLGSTHLPIRKLHELHENSWDFVLDKCVPNTPYQGKRNPYRGPTNIEMARWLAPRGLSKLLKQPFRKSDVVWHWRVGVRTGGHALHDSACKGRSADLNGFRWLESPQGHNWADPFLLEKNGTLWLFFEDFLYREDRGNIKVAPLHRDGTLGDVTTCLDLPYHISYPYVFEHQGEIFMMPETLSNRGVELFRATRFPYEWRLEKVLFQGDVTDTSAWFDGERWWFFTCVEEPKGIVAQCLLFSAGSLTGDWEAHPGNPISSDVRFARNAGAIFREQGKLFRPAQNCTGNYGRSMSLREIVTLNPDKYVERGALDISPDPSWRYIGMHTYNFHGDVEVMDSLKVRTEEPLLVKRRVNRGVPKHSGQRMSETRGSSGCAVWESVLGEWERLQNAQSGRGFRRPDVRTG